MPPYIKRLFSFRHPKLALAIVLFMIFAHFAFPRYIVATGSMIPTMPPGSYVLACRSSIIPTHIKTGDIVVFHPVNGISSEAWIHRIIATEGEIHTPVKKGRKDVSGKAKPLSVAEGSGELTVPSSYYYQSGDSALSYHGLIADEYVLGKVLFHFKLPWR